MARRAFMGWRRYRGGFGRRCGRPRLIDALLSAAGMGDIGGLFAWEPMLRERHARLRYVAKEPSMLLRSHGRMPSSASVVIIGNRPKIGRRREEAERALSDAVGCRVTVTATTTDHMGFTGRGEGIAAIANALVM